MKSIANAVMLPLLITSGAMLAAPARAADAAATMTPPAQAIPAPPPGKGEVVFFRTSIMGALVSCAVKENGVKVSSLPPGHYFVLATEPGKHSFSVESEAKDTINAQIESGEIQYISCHIKMGIMAGRPVLAPATEAQFNAKKLKQVDPAKVMAPASAPAAEATATPAAPATPAAQ